MPNYGLTIFDRAPNVTHRADVYELVHRSCCGFLNMLSGERYVVTVEGSSLSFAPKEQYAMTTRLAMASFFIATSLILSQGTILLGTAVVITTAGLIAGQFSASRALLFQSPFFTPPIQDKPALGGMENPMEFLMPIFMQIQERLSKLPEQQRDKLREELKEVFINPDLGAALKIVEQIFTPDELAILMPQPAPGPGLSAPVSKPITPTRQDSEREIIFKAMNCQTPEARRGLFATVSKESKGHLKRFFHGITINIESIPDFPEYLAAIPEDRQKELFFGDFHFTSPNLLFLLYHHGCPTLREALVEAIPGWIKQEKITDPVIQLACRFPPSVIFSVFAKAPEHLAEALASNIAHFLRAQNDPRGTREEALHLLATVRVTRSDYLFPSIWPKLKPLLELHVAEEDFLFFLDAIGAEDADLRGALLAAELENESNILRQFLLFQAVIHYHEEELPGCLDQVPREKQTVIFFDDIRKLMAKELYALYKHGSSELKADIRQRIPDYESNLQVFAAFVPPDQVLELFEKIPQQQGVLAAISIMSHLHPNKRRDDLAVFSLKLLADLRMKQPGVVQTIFPTLKDLLSAAIEESTTMRDSTKGKYRALLSKFEQPETESSTS